jgi:hypothetical protein
VPDRKNLSEPTAPGRHLATLLKVHPDANSTTRYNYPMVDVHNAVSGQATGPLVTGSACLGAGLHPGVGLPRPIQLPQFVAAAVDGWVTTPNELEEP